MHMKPRQSTTSLPAPSWGGASGSQPPPAQLFLFSPQPLYNATSSRWSVGTSQKKLSTHWGESKRKREVYGLSHRINTLREELAHQELALGTCRNSSALRSSNPHLMGCPDCLLKEALKCGTWTVGGGPNTWITKDTSSYTTPSPLNTDSDCEKAPGWWPAWFHSVSNQVGWQVFQFSLDGWSLTVAVPGVPQQPDSAED